MIIGLSVGIYIVIVIDVNGCEDFVVVVIEEVLEFIVVISGDEIICDLEGEGFVIVMVFGGNLFYSY